MRSSWIALGVCALIVSGCGSEPNPEQSAAATPATTAPKDPMQNMARAVGAGKPGAAVELRYDILSRPEVGKPVEIEIALIPNANVESMEVTVAGMDGITLAGTLSANFNEVKTGTPYKHRFSLLANQNGVFYVTVAASTQISGQTMARNFSIPFVVGTQPVQKKVDPPPADGTGQPVQASPAVETKG